ncbi:hypothetical protein [Streptomyces sp. NBC_00083]|uniref:hypothetical protein n=1 Tax=Streptomyces sp. NBC_00083 TaxID=2975647 RepID=UPI00224F59BD|nr:hypothetical protein [Streptomyces sp. NBC_00083]MCX5381779.1 hypothetical protein [Streptomyces sp. NBC_00083]
MDKFSGPAARAALVAGLVSALSTGYAAHAADHPVLGHPVAGHTATGHAIAARPPAAPPPRLADTGADAPASLLGAVSATAVVTGAAAVALSRRSSRGTDGE